MIASVELVLRLFSLACLDACNTIQVDVECYLDMSLLEQEAPM